MLHSPILEVKRIRLSLIHELLPFCIFRCTGASVAESILSSEEEKKEEEERRRRSADSFTKAPRPPAAHHCLSGAQTGPAWTNGSANVELQARVPLMASL